MNDNSSRGKMYLFNSLNVKGNWTHLVRKNFYFKQ